VYTKQRHRTHTHTTSTDRTDRRAGIAMSYPVRSYILYACVRNDRRDPETCGVGTSSRCVYGYARIGLAVESRTIDPVCT
jgi:hypothetical protein